MIHPLDPAAVAETAEFGAKLLAGSRLFGSIRDSDVEIATTPKDLIWTCDKVSLFHYRPLAERRIGVPVLICYGLVGRWTMADLQADRSLVRNLLNLGLDLYVVDWGNPSRADQFLTLEDYIKGYLADCVAQISSRAGGTKVNLLGICEGGVFTTAFAALHAGSVNALVLAITPIDFHADLDDSRPGHGFLNVFARSLDPDDVDQLIAVHGNLPGEFTGAVFNMMTPMRTLLKYNLDMLDVVDDKRKLLNWLRMEKWIADRPDHPGEAAKQWIKDLYQQNKLVQSEWHLDGERVDLHRITAPVLNVFAEADHIIPPATSRALGSQVSGEYVELCLPGGHIGAFVGGKSQTLFAPGVAAFLQRHDPAVRPDDPASGTADAGTP